MPEEVLKKQTDEKTQKLKRVLRRRAKNERSTKDYAAEDSGIADSLFEFLLRAPANSIICSYLSMPEEFPTAELLGHLHQERPDLTFYLPRIETRVRDGAVMHFYALGFDGGKVAFETLEEDSRGILQPSADMPRLEPSALAPDVTIFFIMPGLLFDRYGFRVGYGGGYYDRYLTRNPARRVLVAPCRQDQYFAEELPHSDRDVKIDCLAMADGLRQVNPDLRLSEAQAALLSKF